MKQYLLGIAVIAELTLGVAQAAPGPNAQGQHNGSATSAQLSPAQRNATIDIIVHTWGPYVQMVYRTNPILWAGRMAATFAAAKDANLLRAARMKTFQDMISALEGTPVSGAKVVDARATRAQLLKSGTTPAALGDPRDDLVYSPIAPCRIVDTRVIKKPIASGTTRPFAGYTSTDFSSQGGISGSNCGIPANPIDLVLNVAAVAPAASGYLTVWPLRETKPLASNLNYAAGAIVGNEIVVGTTSGSPSLDFNVLSSATTDVVVDAVGYFMAPKPTPLNCQTVSRSLAIAAGAQGNEFIACPAAATHGPLTVTSGGCGNTQAGTNLQITWSTQNYGSGGTPTNAWYCQASNTGPNSESLVGYAICCAVPGR